MKATVTVITKFETGNTHSAFFDADIPMEELKGLFGQTKEEMTAGFLAHILYCSIPQTWRDDPLAREYNALDKLS